MLNNEIGLRISYFRNQKGISARELSLTIGKCDNYINKLENHNFNISANILLYILSALEVEPEEFFATNYKTFKRDNELYNLIASMPTDKKENLIQFIKKS